MTLCISSLITFGVCLRQHRRTIIVLHRVQVGLSVYIGELRQHLPRALVLPGIAL